MFKTEAFPSEPLAHAALSDDLAKAEAGIALAEQLITTQWSIVGRMEAAGTDATVSRGFLGQLEEQVALHRAYRDRLLTDLQLLSHHQLQRLAYKDARRRLRLLAAIGKVLATTLEFEDTLTNIAQLVVANLAD